VLLLLLLLLQFIAAKIGKREEGWGMLPALPFERHDKQ
jgi:hypothetical protein